MSEIPKSASASYRSWATEPPRMTEEQARTALARFASAALDRAFEMARRVHGTQRRKDGTPYLEEHVYPVAVAVSEYLLARGASPEEVLTGTVAALLHDALEDRDQAASKVEREEIGEAAGPEAFLLVELLTRPHKDSGAAFSDADYAEKLHRGPSLARVVKVFDRLNNIACVHKVPAMVPRYVEATNEGYVSMAEALDPDLGAELRAITAKLSGLLRPKTTRS